MKNLTVIIPAYNEEKTIASTVEDVLRNKEVDNIVVVDNNSTDNTYNIVKEMYDSHIGERVRIVKEDKQGKGNAFRCGIKECSDSSYIGLIDGDATYPAEKFDYLYSELVVNELDMVVGNRFGEGDYEKNKTRPGHVIGNKFLSHLIKYSSGVDIVDTLSGMRVFSRKFIEEYESLSDGFQLETEFSINCGRNSLKYGERSISYLERDESNPSKLNTLKDGVRILHFAIKNTALTFTTKLSLILGISSIIVGLIFGFRLIEEYLRKDEVTSVALAVLVSILLSTGVQLSLAAANDSRLRRVERHMLKK